MFFYQVYPQGLFSAAFIIVVFSVIGFVVLSWLALRSGHGYSVADTKAHAASYADVIEEGHGGMTAFLWIVYGIILGWTIFYFLQRWGEFARLFQFFGVG